MRTRRTLRRLVTFITVFSLTLSTLPQPQVKPAAAANFPPPAVSAAKPAAPVANAPVGAQASSSNTPQPCTVRSCIASNFNGTAISAGRTIWFNSVLHIQGQITKPITIYFKNSTLQFSANNTNYNLSAPSAAVTFDPAATSATTTFDAAHNQWVTRVPPNLSGNTFLTGLAFSVPSSGLPGGINPVTWCGDFQTDTPGITVQWQWAAAVYTNFSMDNNALGVKGVDDNQSSFYKNSDHAGTPENYKASVIGGARGGGGSNYTGSYSGTGSASPTLCPTPIPTNTPASTPTSTATATASNTATNTPTNITTPTNTPTNTATATNTPTNTASPTNTATNTPTDTPTATFTPSN